MSRQTGVEPGKTSQNCFPGSANSPFSPSFYRAADKVAERINDHLVFETGEKELFVQKWDGTMSTDHYNNYTLLDALYNEGVHRRELTHWPLASSI